MDRDRLVNLYRLMVRTRRFDEKREERATEFPTPQQHPHFGQEAVAVGAVASLRPDDFFLGTHRPIAQAIVKGVDLNRLVAELFTAKAAVWGLMRSLCQEVGRYGITVKAYCPAAYTRMTERLYPEEARPRLRQLLDPAFVVPLLVYLASDEAADITGHTFFIAGNSVEIAELINTPIINRPPSDGPWDPMELGQYVKLFLQDRPANVGKTQWRSVQMIKQM